MAQVLAHHVPGPQDQLHHRDHEGDGEDRAREPGRRRAPPAPQGVAHRAPAAGALVVAGAAPGQPLHGQGHGHEHQQQGGQLGGGLQVEQPEPGLVDGGGEGVVVEHRHGAEVRQGLHEGQGHPRGHRRPGHGQGHPEERPPGPQAQHPGGVQGAAPLGEEGGAREHVDVGVEDQGHHRDDPARRAHRRHPVAAPAEGLAQGALHRAGEVQEPQGHEPQHIGGDGQRQHQGPVEEAPPRELAGAGEPGEAHPQHQDAGGDPGQQHQGVHRELAQDGGGQVAPHLGLGLQPAGEHRQQGQRHQARQKHAGQRQQAPGEGARRRQPDPSGQGIHARRHGVSGSRRGP